MDLILKYFPTLTKKQIELFSALLAVYSEWNAKINVISRKDIDELYLKHVLHSLSIAKYFQFKPGETVIDIGTGGGFPGIPLAIMFPESKFLLVDSIGKKIKVANEVITTLNLQNATAINDRVENLKITPDYYVTRAVATMSDLTTWTKKHKAPIIALKGGDLSDELKKFSKSKKVKLSKYFTEDFFETKFIVDCK